MLRLRLSTPGNHPVATLRAATAGRVVDPGALVVGVLVLALIAPTAAGAASLPGQVSLHPSYTNWFFYHLDGPYFLAGPGDPEGFLYRGTQNADGTRSGDQQALIDKLAPTGANSIYLMAVRSHGGDGDSTENPFVDNDPALGLNPAVLDQWEGWFDQMDAAGITIFFFLYDDGSQLWNTGSSVGAEESEFIHGLVDRFEHYKHLIWVVAEEYQERYTPARVSAIAAEIKAADDHDHPVAVHKLSGLSFTEFANDPWLDQFAIQYNVATAENLHDGIEIAGADAAGRYNLNLSEAADWGTGATSRRKAWASAMAGAYVMVYQMDIATTAVADMEDLGRLRAFMESTDFYTMESRDDLASLGTKYVLAREGKSYIAYADSGSGPLGLQDFEAGRYDLRWLDIVSGNEVVATDLDLDAGSQSWNRPAGIGAELAVYALRRDGTNDPPETVDQTLAAFGTDPLPVTLAYLDPDGPGPYDYTILDAPDHGTLAGTAPDLTYTAEADFAGTDAFTWSVSDGIDASDPATVSIVVGGNNPPSAEDFSLVGYLNTPLPLPFDDHATDPEGMPLSFVIETPPLFGTLTQTGGQWTYLPDAGFTGTDSLVWRASDGTSQSNTAVADIAIAVNVFRDEFDRPTSNDVGNGWEEFENQGQVGIVQETLDFASLDESDRPLVQRRFGAQSGGTVHWSFELGFERTGSESSYGFRMQLGFSTLMSESQPEETGVVVNLVWGGPNNGLSGHERLGAVVDGAVVDLGPVSGQHTVAVNAQFETKTYTVTVDDVVVGQPITFENAVPIDTVRYFTDGLNGQNFSDRWVDDVQVDGTGCEAPDGLEITLSHETVEGVESYEVCEKAEIGPSLTVESGGDVTLVAGASVSFGNGVAIEAGGRLAAGNEPSSD